MTKTAHGRRLWVLTGLLGLAFVVLAGQLVILQYFSHEKYRLLAAQNTQRTYLSQPRRGDILDRNGHPLATCLPVKKIFANPHLINRHHKEVAHVLAPLLQYQPAVLAELLKPVVRTNDRGGFSTNQYVNLRRKVSLQQWEKISQVLAGINFHPTGAKLTPADKRFYLAFRRYAVYALEDQLRIYPSKALACHVVGFAQEKEDEFNRVTVSDLEGKDGVEKCFDEQLRGFPGWRVTETDVRQREIVVYRDEEVAAREGLNVVLTIDMVLQKIVEDELAVAVRENDPVSVSSVIVRPRTGEILAMATLPNFDLNEPGKVPMAAMRNRVITDRMEPGSTFKIVAVASALERRVVGLHETIDCEQGRWMFQGRSLHDHEAHGLMTVEEILIKSSNIGTAKIGLRLGERRLYDSIHNFGFGARTGIILEGEDRGKVHPVNKWDKLMISRIPMGQAVAVTHLQMVMAMSAIANRGRLMRPMLIDRLERPNREVYVQYHPEVVRQVVDPAIAAQVVGALKRVVSSEGTAVKASLEHYTVAGKTGTAEKPGIGGYMPDKYIASFMGFFPADDPELCISVVMDEPKRGYYGGQKAAPVFKRIAEQAAQSLKVHPGPPRAVKRADDSGEKQRPQHRFLPPPVTHAPMQLKQLVRDLPAVSVEGPLDGEVAGITYDSRRVTPGMVFVAIPGQNVDGHEYINSAINRGATAVICERNSIFPRRATKIRVADVREALARAATSYYAHPSSKLKVIGVTGTNGKTTVSFMIKAILEAADIKTGLIGTVQYEIGDRVIPAQRTTPESLEVQQMLAQMLRADCQACVMEVSSHALDQKRVLGVEFDVAIFTNLSRDHLDYHGSMENYFAAKRKLFSAVEEGGKAGAVVVNIDDSYGARLAGQTKVEVELTYGLESAARLRATQIHITREGSRFVVEMADKKFAVRLPLIGRHNIYNALAAVGAGIALHVDVLTVQAALNAMPPVPGRLEPVNMGQPFNVLVDYAHTDDALKNVLETVRELSPGRVLLAFGCGGSRDAGKRAKMGRVAARLADFTIITSDNPRKETPAKIAEQIEQGYRSVRDEACAVELDRAQAIHQIIGMARPKDTVLIAGKGHETYQEFEDTVVPFDDRFHAQEILETLGYSLP